MTDLAVVAQDSRFGGGGAAQVRAFVAGAEALGRAPRIVHAPFVPLVDSFNQALRARGVGRAVRDARSLWVVGAAASYGLGARRSARPYGAWIGTSLDEEWDARRPSLSFARRAALAANAPLLRRIERDVLRGAARVYATSASSQEALAHAAEVDAAEVGILPIPVDVERFAPIDEEEWFALLERPTVVFVGRASDPRKNVRLLLDAWPGVHGRVPSARLRLIGAPPVEPLPAGAEAAGEVASVADELRRASVLVLPSLQEGFGIVVAEALAAGVPAVVTPSGGPEELVRRSGGGTVLDSFDAGALASAIAHLLEDERAALAARAAGRVYVERHHAPEVFRRELALAFGELDG